MFRKPPITDLGRLCCLFLGGLLPLEGGLLGFGGGLLGFGGGILEFGGGGGTCLEGVKGRVGGGGGMAGDPPEEGFEKEGFLGGGGGILERPEGGGREGFLGGGGGKEAGLGRVEGGGGRDCRKEVEGLGGGGRGGTELEGRIEEKEVGGGGGAEGESIIERKEGGDGGEELGEEGVIGLEKEGVGGGGDGVPNVVIAPEEGVVGLALPNADESELPLMVEITVVPNVETGEEEGSELPNEDVGVANEGADGASLELLTNPPDDPISRDAEMKIYIKKLFKEII